MAEEQTLVLYVTTGAAIRFERAWGVEEDPETDTLQFSFKELDVTYFAQFDKTKLAGYVLEQ